MIFSTTFLSIHQLMTKHKNALWLSNTSSKIQLFLFLIIISTNKLYFIKHLLSTSYLGTDLLIFLLPNELEGAVLLACLWPSWLSDCFSNWGPASVSWSSTMEWFMSLSLSLWFSTSSPSSVIAVVDEPITSAMSQSNEPPSSLITSTHVLVTLSINAWHSPLGHPFWAAASFARIVSLSFWDKRWIHKHYTRSSSTIIF